MSIISNRRNQIDQKILRQTLRNNATPAEACLWRAIKGKQVEGLKFRRQFGFGPYVLDFSCPEIRLCIELDGEVHKLYDVEMYDIARTEFLRNNNVYVIRFENEVVFRNVNGIIEEIIRYYEEWKKEHICSDKNITAQAKTLRPDKRTTAQIKIPTAQTTPSPSYSGGEYKCST